MFDGEVKTEGHRYGHGYENTPPTWREIDRQLRRVARDRARVDADELHWLAHAEAARVHHHLGCATVLEYVERVLGYPPRVARERLRVARALTELPRLTAELAAGRHSFSAVRELTRVAAPETEEAWIDAARGACVREIEELVAGRRRGDRPTDPSRPDLRERPLRLDLTPSVLALFRMASRRLEDEAGHPLTDSEVIEAMALTVLGGAPPAADATHGGREDPTHVGPDHATDGATHPRTL